jgi:hypothetical protein
VCPILPWCVVMLLNAASSWRCKDLVLQHRAIFFSRGKRLEMWKCVSVHRDRLPEEVEKKQKKEWCLWTSPPERRSPCQWRTWAVVLAIFLAIFPSSDYFLPLEHPGQPEKTYPSSSSDFEMWRPDPFRDTQFKLKDLKFFSRPRDYFEIFLDVGGSRLKSRLPDLVGAGVSDMGTSNRLARIRGQWCGDNESAGTSRKCECGGPGAFGAGSPYTWRPQTVPKLNNTRGCRVLTF